MTGVYEGLTVIELADRRNQWAGKLLSDGGEKLEAVAEMCGYQSGNSFWVAFKQATGISPKQYQKQIAGAGPGE